MRCLTLFILAGFGLINSSLIPNANAQASGVGLNRWTRSADLTVARARACAAVLGDGRLLVAGGLSDAGPVATVDIYGTDGAFNAGTPMTYPRSGAACVSLNDGRVLVAGGSDGNGSLNSAEIFDPVGNRWQSAGNLSVARQGHQMAVNSWGYVWVAGGTSNGAITGVLELFDPGSGLFQKVGALNTARAEFAMTPVGRSLIVAGGTDGTNVLSSVEIYDGALGAISVAGSMTQARKDFAAAALYDGTVLMTGGVDVYGATLASTEIFDPSAGNSIAGPALLEPRAYHSAYAMKNNGSVLIYGGKGDSLVLDTTEVFAPSTGGIAPGARLNSPRFAEAKAALRPGSYLIAGGRNDQGFLSGSELFQYSTIATDKGDYSPGTTVKISGGGWIAGEQVLVTIAAFPLDQHRIEFTGSAIADGAGNITAPGFGVDKSHLGKEFLITAVGSQSQAQSTFTDGVNPTISYAFSPPSGSGGPGQTVNVTVTITPNPAITGPIPTGSVTPCESGTCLSTAGLAASFSVTGTGGTSCGGSPFACSLIPTGVNNQAAATFSMTFSAGSPTFSVAYCGAACSDLNYNNEVPTSGSTPPGAPIVTYTSQFATTTDLTGGPASPADFGTQVSYVANVCPSTIAGGPCNIAGTMTGTVQFSVNGIASGSPVSLTGTSNGSGSAATASFIPNPSLAVGGPYVITAVYSGDAAHLTSSSTASNGGAASISTTIQKDVTTTAVAVTADLDPTTATQAGRVITLTATTHTAVGISTTPTGSVTFTLQAGTFTNAQSNCGTAAGNQFTAAGTSSAGSTTASCTFTIGPAGVDSYTATYNGDTNTGNSTSSSQTITVVRASTTTTLAPPIDLGNDPTTAMQIGRLVTLSASTATGANVFAAPGGTFTFNFPQGATVANATTNPGACGNLTNGATSATVTATTQTVTTTAGGNGTATATCSFIISGPVQTNTYTVTYNADSSTAASTSASQSITTTKALTNTVLTITSPDTLLSGANTVTQLGRVLTLQIATTAGSNVFVQPGDNFTITLPAGTFLSPSCSTQATGAVTTAATAASVGVTTPYVSIVGSQASAILTCSILVLPLSPAAALGADAYPVSYNGDASTAASSDNKSITTVRDTTSLAVCSSTNTTCTGNTPQTYVYGQTFTLYSVLTSTTGLSAVGAAYAPTKSVTFSGNGLTYVVPITPTSNGGTASITSPANVTFPPSPGTYTLNVNYPTSGVDPYYGASSSQVTFTVTKANTTTTVSSIPTTTAGQPDVRVTVTYQAPGSGVPTGTVQLFAGSIPGPTSALTTTTSNCPTGFAICAVALFSVPTSSYSAAYSGDGNFLPSTSALNASASNSVASSTITLIASPNPGPPNQAVTLTASVSGLNGGNSQPSGTVTFSDNGTLIGIVTLVSSIASCSITLTPGSHTIIASYSGDAIYPAASTNIGVTVIRPAPATAFSSNPATPVFGQPVVLTVRFTGAQGSTATPGGSVQFLNNSLPIGNPVTISGSVATLSFGPLPLGPNSIGVTYGGDSNFASVTRSVGVVKVVQAQVTVALTSATSGNQMTLTAAIAVVAPGAGTPTGSVNFVDSLTNAVLGNATLAGGAAAATVPVTGDPIVAMYLGDTNFLPASSPSSATILLSNAASYATTFAPGEIVTAFGSGLTTQAVAATLPLGTSLGGVTVTVTDSAGVPRPASLFYVSPAQLSFLLPPGTATGAATVAVNTAAGSLTATMTVAASAAGLFTANASGQGPLAAQVVVVTPSGQQTYISTATLSGTAFVNAPITLSPAADSFYLLLYGTGFDNAKSVSVTINGTAFTPTYFGPQGTFAGLDQINVLLPASLAGSGQVNVSIAVDGQTSNVGTIAFQ